ncbi:g6151 [Coccomyxa elongata]
MGMLDDLLDLWALASREELDHSLLAALVLCVALAAVVTACIYRRPRPVYLLNYSVYKPPEEWRCTHDEFLENSRMCGAFNEASIAFQTKMVANGGLGQDTYLPEGVLSHPPQPTMANARKEAEMVLFDSVRDVLRETNLHPRNVDIVIVNCSLFNPTPSLSAMIVHHFKMRPNVITYNLSGMGCSAGIISIGLAKELLQMYPNKNCIVVSTENITQNWYFGNERSMLIPNCLFRVGGAAMLLSNKSTDYWRAKYELQHVVRTHMGASDASYGCVYQKEDEAGKVGVYLSKDLMTIAGHSLKANITTLGPLVLPFSEQILFLANLVSRKVLGKKGKPYVPDFKKAFEHVCIHTGGRGVIDEMQKQLRMTPELMQPSRDALYRYGNVSSSSIWYVLASIETKRGVRRGDRVWQIAFGSGFKCNSAVWRALRHVHTQHEAWLDATPRVNPPKSTPINA